MVYYAHLNPNSKQNLARDRAAEELETDVWDVAIQATFDGRGPALGVDEIAAILRDVAKRIEGRD